MAQKKPKKAKKSTKREEKAVPQPSGTVGAGSPPVGGTVVDTAEPTTAPAPPAPGTPLRSSTTTEQRARP